METELTVVGANAEGPLSDAKPALACDVAGVSINAGTEAALDCTVVAAGVTGVCGVLGALTVDVAGARTAPPPPPPLFLPFFGGGRSSCS